MYVCVCACVFIFHKLMNKFLIITPVKKSHVRQFLVFMPEKYIKGFLFEEDLTLLQSNTFA